MPNARNLEMMESIKADLEGVNAMWVIDACGLTVKEVEQLRNSIREAGAAMTVYKNTIMKKALAELDLVNMDSILEGPSAFVFCTGDVAAAAKRSRDAGFNVISAGCGVPIGTPDDNIRALVKAIKG